MTTIRRPSFSASPQSAALQLAIWGLSAALIALLLPMLAVFWIWSLVTGYAAESETRGAGRLTHDVGNSRFIQLKVNRKRNSLSVIINAPDTDNLLDGLGRETSLRGNW